GALTASLTPENAGQYIIWASCGSSSNGFVLTVASTNSDDDYDGVVDSIELYCGTKVKLAQWLFDTPDWKGIQGQLPLSFTNLDLAPGLSVGAVEINTNLGPSWLTYRESETN